MPRADHVSDTFPTCEVAVAVTVEPALTVALNEAEVDPLDFPAPLTLNVTPPEPEAEKLTVASDAHVTFCE